MPYGDYVWVLYENYKGEVAWRYVQPKEIRFGTSEWHTRQQWLLECYDGEKKAGRTLAMAKIYRWQWHEPEKG